MKILTRIKNVILSFIVGAFGTSLIIDTPERIVMKLPFIFTLIVIVWLLSLIIDFNNEQP